jgi:hypothetical protein
MKKRRRSGKEEKQVKSHAGKPERPGPMMMNIYQKMTMKRTVIFQIASTGLSTRKKLGLTDELRYIYVIEGRPDTNARYISKR